MLLYWNNAIFASIYSNLAIGLADANERFPRTAIQFARPASQQFVRYWTASSTNRRNPGVKSLSWGFELQDLAWPFVELTRHFVQMGLRVHRQVGALRKILPQQAIGILIGTALPRTLRTAEVNVDVGRQRESSMIRQATLCFDAERVLQSNLR